MSWNLEADVEFKGELTKLVKPFVDFYGKDINQVRVHVQRGDYPSQDIIDSRVYADENLAAKIMAEINKYLADDNKITIHFYLEVLEPEYHPIPELVIKGSELEYCLRRRTPIIVGFGNRNAWCGDKFFLRSGRKIDETLISSFLKYFCLETRPESLYLINEESVSIPFNDHFVYHNDISGFVTDIYDIIRLCLHGGKGCYTDGRASYESVLYEENTMSLCKRKGEYRKKFKEFLLNKLPVLEQKRELNISRELVENAVLKYSEVLDFFTDSTGVGFFSKPLLFKYVEMFYISLIDDLVEGNAICTSIYS